MKSSLMEGVARCDVLVVGAGPSGLATANGLAETGLSVIVADSGKALAERDRHSEYETTRGTGKFRGIVAALVSGYYVAEQIRARTASGV